MGESMGKTFFSRTVKNVIYANKQGIDGADLIVSASNEAYPIVKH